MSILRALAALPVYVDDSATEAWSFNAAGYIPIKDEGSGTGSTDSGGAILVTEITDITGLVAWRDYIPVQLSAGTKPYSFDAAGYIPCKKASGSIGPQGEIVSLLHFDGVDEATDITDETGLTWSRVNTSANVDTAFMKFGVSSSRFGTNGNHGGWSATHGSAGFEFGTGDYTIEFFVRLGALAQYHNLFYSADYDANQIGIRVSNANKIQVFFDDSVNDLGILESTSALAADTWYHVALVRSSGVTTLYIDGVVEASSSAEYNVATTAGPARLGHWSLNNTNFLSGHIDEFRVNKGYAYYVGAFTPPSAAFPNP